MNHDQIESAIEHAINALALAKLALSKSALPVFNDSDVLRKVDLDLDLRAGDAVSRALAQLADAEKRIERIEAARDIEAQYERRRVERSAVQR